VQKFFFFVSDDMPYPNGNHDDEPSSVYNAKPKEETEEQQQEHLNDSIWLDDGPGEDELTERNYQHLVREFYNRGYRDGKLQSEEQQLQKGFDQGFREIAPIARMSGVIEGLVKTLLTLLTDENHPRQSQGDMMDKIRITMRQRDKVGEKEPDKNVLMASVRKQLTDELNVSNLLKKPGNLREHRSDVIDQLEHLKDRMDEVILMRNMVMDQRDRILNILTCLEYDEIDGGDDPIHIIRTMLQSLPSLELDHH
jgi:hypothetical protein